MKLTCNTMATGGLAKQHIQPSNIVLLARFTCGVPIHLLYRHSSAAHVDLFIISLYSTSPTL